MCMLLRWPLNSANGSGRDAGVSGELIRLFVDIEPAALDRLYRMAEAKFVAAKNATDDRYHGCQ